MHKIVIAGAGGIGQAVGLILAAMEGFDAEIYLGDLYIDRARDAAQWINEGTSGSQASAFEMPGEGTNEIMHEVMQDADVILDCLPGSQAPRIAALAKKFKMHYANLTEYVQETEDVLKIAKDADTGFVLQTGLAPGFINVLGHKLFQEFTSKHKVETVDRMTMKVGALTQNAKSPHFYGFTWSPVGVATEYLKDAEVIRNWKKTNVPSLSEARTIIIDGVTYEDNFTSGGAADLPDALAGKVKELDYKTLRYPGHYQWVESVLDVAPPGQDQIDYLQKVMLYTVPSLEDDVVIIYASVSGKDHEGTLRGIEKSYRIEPMMVGNRLLRAIQTTTASPLAEAARLLLTGKWKGPVLQSQIDPDSFLNGPFVSQVYGKYS